MRTQYGNIVEFTTFDVDKIPDMFRNVFNPLIAGIRRRGGEPILETMQIRFKQGIPPEIPGSFGIKIEAEFQKNILEEINNEWQAGGKGGGKENRGDDSHPSV